MSVLFGMHAEQALRLKAEADSETKLCVSEVCLCIEPKGLLRLHATLLTDVRGVNFQEQS